PFSPSLQNIRETTTASSHSMKRCRREGGKSFKKEPCKIRLRVRQIPPRKTIRSQRRQRPQPIQRLVRPGRPKPFPYQPPESNTAVISPQNNEVNQLVVVNHSNKALYLMPGEIIIGGSQDRTIGQELVIAPDNKPVAIDVFCVEHGRWGGRDERVYAGLLAR